MAQFTEATTPGAFLVDVFPLLRHMPAWFPGASFKKTAREWSDTLNNMADVPHAFVKEQMVSTIRSRARFVLTRLQANGTEVPSFTSELLRDEKLKEGQEFNIKWSAASLYAGKTSI